MFAVLLVCSTLFIALNENAFARPEIDRGVAAGFAPALVGHLNASANLVRCLVVRCLGDAPISARHLTRRHARRSQVSAVSTPLLASGQQTNKADLTEAGDSASEYVGRDRRTLSMLTTPLDDLFEDQGVLGRRVPRHILMGHPCDALQAVPRDFALAFGAGSAARVRSASAYCWGTVAGGGTAGCC